MISKDFLHSISTPFLTACTGGQRETIMVMQQLPVRIYRSEHQFALAAPLAGLEPGDIHITIDGKHVTIEGRVRGPRQDQLDLLQAEWSIGPYHREIDLPEEVDGSLANATYGNGVLVLTIPKANVPQKPARAEFTLEAVRPTRGERVGHTGHDIRATTTREHWARLAKVSKRPAA
jgi:HSP20 family protein